MKSRRAGMQIQMWLYSTWHSMKEKCTLALRVTLKMCHKLDCGMVFTLHSDVSWDWKTATTTAHADEHNRCQTWVGGQDSVKFRHDLLTKPNHKFSVENVPLHHLLKTCVLACAGIQRVPTTQVSAEAAAWGSLRAKACGYVCNTTWMGLIHLLAHTPHSLAAFCTPSKLICMQKPVAGCGLCLMDPTSNMELKKPHPELPLEKSLIDGLCMNCTK